MVRRMNYSEGQLGSIQMENNNLQEGIKRFKIIVLWCFLPEFSLKNRIGKGGSCTMSSLCLLSDQI